MMNDRADYGWVVVRNDYGWEGGDPYYAQLVTYIDGKRKGSSQYGDSARIPVYSGSHAVYIKLFAWYRSRPIRIDIDRGSTIHFRGDVPRNGHLLMRILKGMVDPFHWLVLEQIGDDPGAGPLAE